MEIGVKSSRAALLSVRVGVGTHLIKHKIMATETVTAERIGVVGGGQMGSGIAQVAAMHGIDVWLLDVDPQALSKASSSISNSINRLVSKSLLSQVNNKF